MQQDAVEATMTVEKRTIDHIPVTERHGRARDLFTIWFGSNIMLLTVATGVVATAVYGLPVWAAAVALVIGHAIGGVVMALHAAQGPQMGVPQMLQTRAQFGSYGSLLVVVLVIFMYVGFFASNMVLGGQAVSSLFGLDETVSIIVIGLVSVVGAVVGYRMIHALTGLMSLVSGLVLILAFVWMIGIHELPAGTFHTDGATMVGFMGTISLAALWQIAYAPYVSDYTRYMPRDTGVRPAFWATYAGAVLGSLFPMLLGAIVGAALPEADTVTGLQDLTTGVGGPIIAVFGIGIACTNAMNLYCGALSTITVGQTIFPRWVPGASARAVVSAVLFAGAVVMALVGKDNFLVNFTNFMLLLLCVLVPWTAVNLVDYYVLKHGEYDIDSLFERDGGRYGRFNLIAVACYFLGILVQIPFLSTAMYVGPFAEKLGGVDISWIVGLAVISPLYLFLMKRFTRFTGHRQVVEAGGVA
ncbi:purine-cytosine permease family protein [Nocardioides albus]|uniref:NCS1 family nucleobase:cation symporter-1 n=1 Tax=Nocardioides albus TaxID=1841 RepID=A0A7W5A4B4_9ACTN|nr:cytosine permease [Nocardioides albus]MBB3089165.1 NCS1 family nucleobase:cation symporter-1 [Nocardioides albus]GGU13828.1 allantoin permease [Nocardioides albus]